MLATASIGAIWSSCSPDFGLPGALDRFGQIEPRVLLAADGYFHKGKTIDVLDRVAGLADGLPSVERVVVVPYARQNSPLDGVRNAILYRDFLAATETQPAFAQLPFDHPLFVLYSSGTTGVP
jgi:acetoacetyl-CoA synthetase